MEQGSSDDEPEYLLEIPESYLALWSVALWSDEEKEWAASLYESSDFMGARKRLVEIGERLSGLRRRPERSALVKELSDLKYGEAEGMASS